MASLRENPVPLLERADELDALNRRIDRVRDGRGAMVVIEGVAGIGKTTLLRAGVELAEAADLLVLRARAGEVEQDVSWNLVRQLFAEVIRGDVERRSDLLRGAAALAAPALGLEPGADAGALHGLYWLTAELAYNRPALLAVDDAQWGDAPSLGYLAYIAERVEDLPVLIVATLRRGEALPEPLSIMRSKPHAEILSLRELGAGGAAALTRGLLGPGAADEFCQACYDATRGNPFLLGALLDQLRRDETEPTAARAEDVARITPSSVSRSVLLRLSRLPEPARELAIAVAVLGDASLTEAAGTAGLSTEAAAEAADALSGAGILVPGSPLQFVHAIVRETIYRELSELQRARRHRRAAQVLADAGQHRRVPAQLLPSAPDRDPWVVQQLRAAADAALAEGAPQTAANLLRRALEEPPSDDELLDVLVVLARAEAAAGDGEPAARLTAASALTLEPLRRAELQLERGRLLYLAGRVREAADAFDEGLREAAADPHDDPSLAAELRSGWLTVARLEIPLRIRAEEMTRAIAAEPPLGGSYGERALLAHVAGQLTFEGSPRERSIELGYRALGDGALIAQETSDGLAWVAAMGALGWGDEFDGFMVLQDEALADARRRGSVIGFATAMYGCNFAHYYDGRLLDAVADAEEAIAAERDGWRHFLTAARAQLAWALIERGELDAAEAQLELAAKDEGLEENSAQALVLEAWARIELIRGYPDQALEHALAAGRMFSDQARITNPSILPWRSRAASAAAALGDRDQAEELVEDELARARSYGAPRPIGVALITAGVIRGTAGIEPLEEAVGVLERSPARLEHARALVLLGAALRRNGSLNAARDALQRGLDHADSFGAVLLQERARAELEAVGLRPRRRPVSGADSLTPAELRVAELAVAGLSNREIAQALFVSLRTVETHLTHCYQKLDVDSRGKLAPALGERH